MHPRVPLLLLALGMVSCAVALADPAETPGRGVKITRQTVGNTPQSLTGTERAKLEQSRSMPPAATPHVALRPAPWLPPGWGPASPLVIVAGPAAHPAAGGPAKPGAIATPLDPHAEHRSALGRVSHGGAHPVKGTPVSTIANGPHDATPAEIAAKRPKPITAHPGASR